MGHSDNQPQDQVTFVMGSEPDSDANQETHPNRSEETMAIIPGRDEPPKSLASLSVLNTQPKPNNPTEYDPLLYHHDMPPNNCVKASFWLLLTTTLGGCATLTAMADQLPDSAISGLLLLYALAAALVIFASIDLCNDRNFYPSACRPTA